MKYCALIADLPAAESAFVRCADFAALQLLHKLNNLPEGSDLIKAEVAAYFHKFDEAEKIYFHNERRFVSVLSPSQFRILYYSKYVLIDMIDVQ